MKRGREHFNEERLHWRVWEEHPNWHAWNSGAVSSEQAIPPILRETVLKMREGIQQAIADAEHTQDLSYEVVQGHLITTIGGRSIYQFHLVKDVDLREQTSVHAMISQQNGEDQKIEARVVSRMELGIRLSTREPLPEEQLTHLVLVEDATWLLKRQLRALDHIRETEAQMGAKTLGLLPTRSGIEVVRQLRTFVPNDSQKQAITHGLGSEQTFIVGPGGTGKTVTTSNLICQYLDQGLSVLLVSHTNIATDNAFLDVVNTLLANIGSELTSLVAPGLIVRQGTPHHPNLLTGEYRELTVEALAEQRMRTQTEARKHAEKTRQELLQQIEHLEHEIHQGESDWQPRKEKYEQQSEPLCQSLIRLRKEQEKRSEKQQKVSDAKAKAQKEASNQLALFLQKYQQFLEKRQFWRKERQRHTEAWQAAQNELTSVQDMGRVKRFFSSYKNYDFAAATQHVAQLLQKQGTAITALATLEQHIQANKQAREELKAELARLTTEEQQWQDYLASFVDPAAAQITQQEQALAQIQKALEDGEASLVECRKQWEQRREKLSEIEVQLEKLREEQGSFRAQIVAEARLVATTTTGVYVNPRLLERAFDVVVIDELSMVPLVSVLLVATRATRKFVGAGDPTQLSPVLKLNKQNLAPLAREWLGKNLYTHLGITIRNAINGEKDCVLLTEQGRMHPKIAEPINTRVYEGMLANREETENFPPRGPYPDWPLMLVDSSRSGARTIKRNEQTARVNTVHADIDVALVRMALADLPPRSSENQFSISPRIGVITPYRSQVHLIRKKLREVRLLQDVHVGTINTVQSLQFEMVIFDTVEAPGLQPFDFTFDAIFDAQGMATEATRLLNVAHTRARYKLIYVAHRDWLHQWQPSSPDNERSSRRLLVELVDEAYKLGHVSATEILGQ